MTPEFPNLSYKSWSAEDQARLKWLVRLGVKIQWLTDDGWEFDDYPSPDTWPGLVYRVKPKDE